MPQGYAADQLEAQPFRRIGTRSGQNHTGSRSIIRGVAAMYRTVQATGIGYPVDIA